MNGMNKKRVQIVVATHKKYWMPSDQMYLPLQVGAENSDLELGYVKDNTGDNISALNGSFCELTGLYWAWKNANADYIGLVHYRRHFSLKKKGKNPTGNVLTFKELKPLLKKYRVFVPKKRKYYIETLYSHYKHTHYAEHLDITKEIIAERHPEYSDVFHCVMKHRWGYMFNMNIMEKALVDAYCEWLFDILFAMKERIHWWEESFYQGRFYGRVSELLFNVWLEYQVESGKLKPKDIREVPYIYTEKINWWKKGIAFLKAKFLGKKYEGSF